ncbi:MAG: DUF1922 domain-containing protein [Methanobacteriota archaeon]|nr:MAG: DUF1922 domain-containing protein [Euryarchaeota archaeon]TLZ95478.1 MAG: DUF1922 domain-containing protein [Euryarchaeota archaeon]
MTMYGVVVCPRCKRAKGVDLKQKTTTCLCGFEIRVVPSRVRARANTARELAPLVGQVSAEIAGGLKAYREAAAPVRRIRPRDVHLRVIGIASKAQGRANRVRAAAVELTRELEVFSMPDWERVLAGLGIPHPEEALAALVRANLVLEPTSGFYRAVSLSPEA